MSTVFHDLKLPMPGELYEEKGGYFAGLIRLPDGLYGLIVPPKGLAKPGDFAWGVYGEKVSGADSLVDGWANTLALQALPEPQARAAHAVKGFEHAGHADWYLGSQKENVLAWVTCSDQIECKWHWSSTQFSADYAWAQDFHNGTTNVSIKTDSLGVLPVRRFKISNS